MIQILRLFRATMKIDRDEVDDSVFSKRFEFHKDQVRVVVRVVMRTRPPSVGDEIDRGR